MVRQQPLTAMLLEMARVAARVGAWMVTRPPASITVQGFDCAEVFDDAGEHGLDFNPKARVAERSRQDAEAGRSKPRPYKLVDDSFGHGGVCKLERRGQEAGEEM